MGRQYTIERHLVLNRLCAAGVTLIVAEHRLREVADMASRMLVLHQGRLVADGPPRQVLAGQVAVWGLEAPETMPSLPPAPPGFLAEPVLEWDLVGCERDGRPVLREASLTSAAGEIVALLGANGAGKTTLLRHGNGLLRCQRGVVRVLGRTVGRRPVAELAREVGLVMQQPARMLFASSVRAELAAGPRALNRHDPAWCARLSERFSLDPLLDRPPQTLSAGEQRRCWLPGRGRCCWTSRPPARTPALAPPCAPCSGNAPPRVWRSPWRPTIPSGPTPSVIAGRFWPRAGSPPPPIRLP